MKNYHSNIADDSRHAISRALERFGLKLKVKDLSNINKLIEQGKFKAMHSIQCHKPNRTAYLGFFRNIKILVVRKDSTGRITTFLPLARIGEENDFRSIGHEFNFDSLLIEKARQMPRLN